MNIGCIRLDPGTPGTKKSVAWSGSRFTVRPPATTPTTPTDIEREAIQWEAAAPVEELDAALGQALASWELLVANSAEDQFEPFELVPIEFCNSCGSAESWWDLRDQRHCFDCDPPTTARRLAQQARMLRRLSESQREGNQD